MLSAFYQGDRGAVLRVWNTTDDEVQAKITTTLPFRSARKIAMSEEGEGEPLPMRGGTISLPLRGAEIATIRLNQ